MRPLKKSIEDAGGVSGVAAACKVSPRAVYKWLAAESLPRTEYTGETDYAKRISDLATSKGKPFEADWLLGEAHPSKQQKTAA